MPSARLLKPEKPIRFDDATARSKARSVAPPGKKAKRKVRRKKRR